MKKGIIVLCWLCSTVMVRAQIPAGYYDSANGLTGEELRTALYNIIKDHTSVSYDAIKTTHHPVTDEKSNGKVWDMYSDVPGGTPSYEYSFVSGDQCGNYSAEGDCYNREHSFPQNWFNSDYPMQSDLFHVYPTDGYVNGRRGNSPYGYVASASWTSTNGSKLGTSGTQGYSGTVFEPIDEYKGDFARTYFYMVTRYKNVTSGWTSDMLSGDDLSEWAITMLMEWSDNDPVSQKEIDRNNAVYGIQNNRNPYIDDPVYIEKVWGNWVDGVEDAFMQARMHYSNGNLYIESDDASQGKVTVMTATGAISSTHTVDEKNEAIPLTLNSGMYIAVYNGTALRFSVY